MALTCFWNYYIKENRGRTIAQGELDNLDMINQGKYHTQEKLVVVMFKNSKVGAGAVVQ